VYESCPRRGATVRVAVSANPPLERIDLLDWRAFDRVIELGYRYTNENLHHYRAALDQNRTQKNNPRRYPS
jgi:hypothetical protein